MEAGGGFGGAFGGGKAGAAQDPVSFVKKPVVVVRICSLVFAIIVFGCISSQGWSWEDEVKREVCILNRTPSACHFPTFVGVIAFLVSIGLLVGEWFFEQMSSIKTRKHFVIVDMGFSGLWAFFYFVAFVYMCIAWSKTDEEFSYGSSNIIGAIFFALLSVASWGGSCFFAHQRFKTGVESAFTAGLGDEEGVGGDGGYQSYPGGGADDGGQYNEPPFAGGQAGTQYHQQMQY